MRWPVLMIYNDQRPSIFTHLVLYTSSPRYTSDVYPHCLTTIYKDHRDSQSRGAGSLHYDCVFGLAYMTNPRLTIFSATSSPLHPPSSLRILTTFLTSTMDNLILAIGTLALTGE